VPASGAAASPKPAPGGEQGAGNGAARRLLIEAAWCYRFPARVGRELLLRQEEQPKRIREIAWKAQVRLCARYRKLARTGKPANVVTAAIARELSGFVWAIARQVPVTGADPENRRVAAKGGAGEPPDMLLAGKAGGVAAVRRTLATTICRAIGPTQVTRPRQLRDASPVMRFQPAHQSMINRRHDGRASCPAQYSLQRALERKPRIRLPATWKGGHESGAKLTNDFDRLLSVAAAQAGVQGKRPVPAAPWSSQRQALGSRFRGNDEEVRDGC
jgi:hypothetical protein